LKAVSRLHSHIDQTEGNGELLLLIYWLQIAKNTPIGSV
jgi:hypothetical protein